MEFTSRQFRAFLLVAQHRSFSRAAEALYITPSGLSVLIKELESQLGFRLFNRTTRHVDLTAHGSELLAVVQQSLENLDAAVSRIGRLATEGSMSLSVGAPPLIAANVLPEVVKEFRGHRPDIRIQVFDVGGDALTQMVESGKLDMSVGGFFKPSSAIRRTPLFRFSLMVIRPDHDPTLRRTSTTWSALKGERLISLTPGQLVQQFIDKHLARIGVVAPSVRSFQLPRYANCDGGSWRGCCHHSFLRAARLPKSQSRPKPADQPRRKSRLLLDQQSRKETSTRCRRFHFFPQELYRQVGWALGHFVTCDGCRLTRLVSTRSSVSLPRLLRPREMRDRRCATDETTPE